MSQNFLSGNVSTAIDTQRVLEVKILNKLNATSGGGGTGGAGVQGVGSPEGVVTASVATMYRNTATDALWWKDTGAGSTGWVQITGPF